jgi:pyruvate formate-lyase activating enzyme-like uncharacterized protein|tara:strand:+ start:188 stop:403 length:216 start_codon:yes stop_codon:yes gene_type:complete
MSKTKNWIMDIEEKLWDDVAKEIPSCEHESEAHTKAIKLADATGLLGNYIEVEQVEEAVNEMWQEFWAKFD